MQCSSPESFASVDHAQPGEEHRSVLRTTLSKITLYNFAAAHRLDTPIELTERLLLRILLANEDRHLSRTELHKITKINPSTIDSALLMSCLLLLPWLGPAREQSKVEKPTFTAA